MAFLLSRRLVGRPTDVVSFLYLDLGKQLLAPLSFLKSAWGSNPLFFFFFPASRVLRRLVSVRRNFSSQCSCCCCYRTFNAESHNDETKSCALSSGFRVNVPASKVVQQKRIGTECWWVNLTTWSAQANMETYKHGFSINRMGDWIDLARRMGQMTGSCEQADEPSGSIK
jgi:hypothetical protein